MRRTLRWAWPVLLLAALVLVPRAIYAFRESTPLDEVVLDKAVPKTFLRVCFLIPVVMIWLK